MIETTTLTPPPCPEPFKVRRWGALWREKVKERGLLFFAVAPTQVISPHAPDPKQVPHSFSAVFNEGWRTYAFRDEEQHLNFLKVYRQAFKCEDPLNG